MDKDSDKQLNKEKKPGKFYLVFLLLYIMFVGNVLKSNGDMQKTNKYYLSTKI